VAGPAFAAELPLPAPNPAPPLPPGLGATKDRLRTTVLPKGGTATDVEDVDVGMAGDGTPDSVTVDQQLHLSGVGDFVVIERGPARHAVALDGTDPPTLKLGGVIYTGYVPPSGRDLHARLTLDPALEQPRLPLVVTLSYTPAGGTTPRPLGPGGTVPGAGTVRVLLRNSTSAPVAVREGDVAAQDLAPLLDALRGAAERGTRPPVVGAGLPTTIPATRVGPEASVDISVPLRVTGSISGPPGARLRGPAVRSQGAGGTLDGTLDDAATFTLDVIGAGTVTLDLTAHPTLDRRTLRPPGGAASWRAWARRPHAPRELAAASSTLILSAARSAHLRDVSPYLVTDLNGDVRTSFHLHLSGGPAARVAAAPLHVRPGAIVLVLVASALVIGDAVLLRRRLVGRPVLSPGRRWGGPAAARRR
jgi:hypothetical protein